MENIVQLIKKPIVTEKSSRLNEVSMQGSVARSEVVFEVSKSANKLQIKKAVEMLFSVKVDRVRTLIVPKRTKKVGRYTGWKASWKKAIITLSEGSRIDFFEGV